MLRGFGILLAAALLPSPAAAMPDVVYVMRHLERDPGGDPDLNAAGRQNAGRLATWFRRDRPAAIFVTQFRRAQQTAAPLAAKAGIKPVVYDANAPQQMLAAVRAAKAPVLIVGHSNTVPALIEALGGPKAGGDLSDADYGRIFKLRRGKLDIVRLADLQPR